VLVKVLVTVLVTVLVRLVGMGSLGSLVTPRIQRRRKLSLAMLLLVLLTRLRPRKGVTMAMPRLPTLALPLLV
jgi:hypothetical protein